MSASAGAEEDQVSEAPSSPYIPGDEISVDIGHFEHRQHLLYVIAEYANDYNAENVIELEGTPETAGSVMEPTPSERWFNSRVTLSATIREDTLPGRYWFQRIRGRTYGEGWVSFERDAEKMQLRNIPTYIEVRPEPGTEPRLM